MKKSLSFHLDFSLFANLLKSLTDFIMTLVDFSVSKLR